MSINREHFDQKAMAKVILVYGNFTKCIHFAQFVGFPHRNKEFTAVPPALDNKRVIPKTIKDIYFCEYQTGKMSKFEF